MEILFWIVIGVVAIHVAVFVACLFRPNKIEDVCGDTDGLRIVVAYEGYCVEQVSWRGNWGWYEIYRCWKLDDAKAHVEMLRDRARHQRNSGKVVA